ncbi:MAG: helix-turn-helix transcriptional regulator [Actinobacteria bacterium]|nr:helix-turn-helix transcriptional regulator [Actinomycetota bacterium]
MQQHRTPGPETLSRLCTGLLIRDARRYSGLTQAELARRLGTTQSAVSAWERGHDTPRVDTLARILAACGFEADLVLRHRDDVDRSQLALHLAMRPAERVRMLHRGVEAVGRARRAHPVPIDA